MKNVDKIIKERHSVRKYIDKEIKSELVDKLNDLIKECNKEGNTYAFVHDNIKKINPINIKGKLSF